MLDRVFATSELVVQLAIEIEFDLITEYKNKLKIDDFSIRDPFKIAHGLMEEDEGMVV